MNDRPFDRAEGDSRGDDLVPFRHGRRDHRPVVERGAPAGLASDGERGHHLDRLLEADPGPMEAGRRVAPEDSKVTQAPPHRASSDDHLQGVGVSEPEAVDRRPLLRRERRVEADRPGLEHSQRDRDDDVHGMRFRDRGVGPGLEAKAHLVWTEHDVGHRHVRAHPVPERGRDPLGEGRYPSTSRKLRKPNGSDAACCSSTGPRTPIDPGRVA